MSGNFLFYACKNPRAHAKKETAVKNSRAVLARWSSLLILALTLSACGGGGPNERPYTVGGTVTGLATGNSVVLLNNGGDSTTVSANTTFAFATALAPNTQYAVTVGTQPAGQTCAVIDGSGTNTTGNVTNVSVTCAAKFLYASAYAGPNTFPSAIYGFAVDPSGALSLVPGSPVGTGNGQTFAITRDSKLLYATDNTQGFSQPLHVLAFQIHADGSLTDAPVPSYSMSGSWAGLVAHPAADFLYASGDSRVLTAFAIDTATGALSPTSSVTFGRFLTTALITPSGQYLYLADLDRNDGLFPASVQLAGFSTDAVTGALNPVPGSPLTPTTPSPSTTTGIAPMAIDPTGKFLYVGYSFVDVNVGSDGGLFAYSIDAASGALTPVPGSPFGVGGAPISAAIDASGKFLLVSMYPLGGGSRLAEFSIDPGTGALTSIPGSFGPTYNWGALAADPSGPYVYAGATLQNTNGPAIVFMLSIDQSTGALASIGQTTIPDKVGVSSLALTH